MKTKQYSKYEQRKLATDRPKISKETIIYMLHLGFSLLCYCAISFKCTSNITAKNQKDNDQIISFILEKYLFNFNICR